MVIFDIALGIFFIGLGIFTIVDHQSRLISYTDFALAICLFVRCKRRLDGGGK